MKISEFLKLKRKEKGYSVHELGKIIGVNGGTISRWETGEIENLKRNRIASLAKALEVSPILFIYDEVDESEISQSNININVEEKELLIAFRSLSRVDKDEILNFIDFKIAKNKA